MLARTRRVRRSGVQKHPLLVRAALWFATFLAVATFGLRLAEPVLVDHSLCEHGELEHVARAAAHAGSSTSRHAAATEGSSRSSSHEHCDARAVHHVGGEISVAIGAPTLLTEIAYDGPSARAAEPQVEPLALAPKTSPPAA
jgi:hypothetical protein